MDLVVTWIREGSGIAQEESGQLQDGECCNKDAATKRNRGWKRSNLLK
jgi:hypothetical protein